MEQADDGHPGRNRFPGAIRARTGSVPSGETERSENQILVLSERKPLGTSPTKRFGLAERIL